VTGNVELTPGALFDELAELPRESPAYRELRGRIVEHFAPLAQQLARRFANRGEPLEDLTQVANVGLINAVDRFDTTRGVEFTSYAVPTIAGEIKRHFRDQSWSVRVPRRLKELHLAITGATAELSQRLGRAPNATELSAHLKLDRQEVLEGLTAANAYHSSSLDEADFGDDDSPSLLNTLGENDPALANVEYRESLQPLLAALPERERTIVILRFFANLTQSQIADKVGVSQMHVSRLLSQTLRRLRRELQRPD